MRKTIRNISLLAVLLLVAASGSWYLGYRQQTFEQERIEAIEPRLGYPHVIIETSGWTKLGFLFFVLSVSFAFAAYFLWRRDEPERH